MVFRLFGPSEISRVNRSRVGKTAALNGDFTKKDRSKTFSFEAEPDQAGQTAALLRRAGAVNVKSGRRPSRIIRVRCPKRSWSARCPRAAQGRRPCNTDPVFVAVLSMPSKSTGWSIGTFHRGRSAFCAESGTKRSLAGPGRPLHDPVCAGRIVQCPGRLFRSRLTKVRAMLLPAPAVPRDLSTEQVRGFQCAPVRSGMHADLPRHRDAPARAGSVEILAKGLRQFDLCDAIGRF